MNISLITAPLAAIRNKQPGDWFFRPNESIIAVAPEELTDPRYRVLMQVHEMMEAILCKFRGISEEEVSQWDADTNGRLPEGYEENGDIPTAPYHKEHVFAENVERLLAAELGVSWVEYGREINKLLGK